MSTETTTDLERELSDANARRDTIRSRAAAIASRLDETSRARAIALAGGEALSPSTNDEIRELSTNAAALSDAAALLDARIAELSGQLETARRGEARAAAYELADAAVKEFHRACAARRRALREFALVTLPALLAAVAAAKEAGQSASAARCAIDPQASPLQVQDEYSLTNLDGSSRLNLGEAEVVRAMRQYAAGLREMGDTDMGDNE